MVKDETPQGYVRTKSGLLIKAETLSEDIKKASFFRSLLNRLKR